MNALDQTRSAVINGKTAEIRCLLNTGDNRPEIIIVVNGVVAVSKRFHHGRWYTETRHARAKAAQVAETLLTPDSVIEAAYNKALDEDLAAAEEYITELKETLDRAYDRRSKLNKLKATT